MPKIFRSLEYRSWESMKSRCLNPNNPCYAQYGGRGLSFCERWSDFEEFYKDMGARPKGTSLDRIDNCKGYFPENCRWASYKEQTLNRKTTVWIEYNNEKMCVKDWAIKLEIDPGTIFMRLKKGWGIEKTLTYPRRSYRKADPKRYPGLS